VNTAKVSQNNVRRLVSVEIRHKSRRTEGLDRSRHTWCVVGCVRVSAGDQDDARQVEALGTIDRLFSGKANGKAKGRRRSSPASKDAVFHDQRRRKARQHQCSSGAEARCGNGRVAHPNRFLTRLPRSSTQHRGTRLRASVTSEHPDIVYLDASPAESTT